MRVLVTGGAGFIGSQCSLQILKRGYNLSVVDNLSNGSLAALIRVKKLANRELDFYNCDIRDEQNLNDIFASVQPDVVIHFAGLKSVSDSILMPKIYSEVNVDGTSTLLAAMDKVDCQKIVFSSSATVYGYPQYLPCDELHPVNPLNPYGNTKLLAEGLLKSWSTFDSERRALCLRYFNPVGADQSGKLGEAPAGHPNNLMPLIAQVAIGRKECLKVYGDDYDTIDGSGVRDYIHVVDLADAHVVALEKFPYLKGFEVINVGTGKGTSVLQLIREFERQSKRKIQYEIARRRSGDAPAVWADVSLAQAKLDFKAKFGLSTMCFDTWRWQRYHPDGYSS